MPITTMNDAFINSLLADASYVDLGVNANSALADRLTQPLADFITQNFTVKTQEIAPSNSFSAVVWEGKAGTDYSGKVYLSMRGTADMPTDIIDDAGLAAFGVPYDQIAEMVNWWLRETTPAGQHVTQLRVAGGLGYYYFEIDNSVNIQGTGHLTNISHIDSVNGHSLGGYLATSFERIFGSSTSIGHISTYNSAGFGNTPAHFVNINQAFANISNLTGLTLDPAFNNNLQTNYFGENGFEFTTNVWRPIGFNQIGSRVGLYQEDGLEGDPINNHYLYKLTDMLALGDAISKLDNSFTIPQLNELVKASSNQMEASYERLLDGFRKTIMGGDVFATGIGDTSSGTDENPVPPSRVDFHFRLSQLVKYNGFQDLMGQFTVVNSPASIEEAKNDFGAFLSLVYLTPFALKANDAGGTLYLQNSTFDNAQLAAKWEQDKSLTPEQIANGEQNFSDNWITDRIAMLAWQNTVNIEDIETTQDNPYVTQGIGKHFYDYASSNGIFTGIQNENTQQIIFGDDQDNAHIEGGNQADHLYGGVGFDLLRGNGGNDYLEGGDDSDILEGGDGSDKLLGGTGDDTYIYATGDGFDAIVDSDGLGNITVDDMALGAGKQYGDNRVYQFTDANNKKHNYVFVAGDKDTGGDVIVDGNILIKGY